MLKLTPGFRGKNGWSVQNKAVINSEKHPTINNDCSKSAQMPLPSPERFPKKAIFFGHGHVYFQICGKFNVSPVEARKGLEMLTITGFCFRNLRRGVSQE